LAPNHGAVEPENIGDKKKRKKVEMTKRRLKKIIKMKC
jgi:hypothetical protein